MMAPRFTESEGLEIEAVWWRPAGEQTLIVEVVARWRATAPPPRPVLVVDDGRQRVRFPARPGAGDAATGTLSASFALPVELRGALDGGLALAPATPGPPAGAPAAPAPQVVDRAVLADRRARRAELGEQSEARRAAEAEDLAAQLSVRVARLERELERAVGEPERMAAALARLDRELRRERQGADAERRRAGEAVGEERERARRTAAEAAAARDSLRIVRARVAELEREVDVSRRAAPARAPAPVLGANGERAGAPLVGRERGPLARVLAAAEPRAPRLIAAPAGRLAGESLLLERAAAASAPWPRRAPPAGEPVGLAFERALLTARRRARAAPAANAAAQAGSEGVGARLDAARRHLAERADLERQLDELRAQLAARPPSAPPQAPAARELLGVARAAIAEARAAIAQARERIAELEAERARTPEGWRRRTLRRMRLGRRHQ